MKTTVVWLAPLITQNSRVSSTQRTQEGRIAFHVVKTGIPSEVRRGADNAVVLRNLEA
jgi:hypothetical protein